MVHKHPMAETPHSSPGLSHSPFPLHPGLLRRSFSVYFLLFLQAKPAKTAKNRPFVSAVGAKSAGEWESPDSSLAKYPIKVKCDILRSTTWCILTQKRVSPENYTLQDVILWIAWLLFL